MRIKILLLFCLLTLPAVHADVTDDIRKQGLKYAKPLEVIMVDGPLHVGGQAHYVLDYVKPDSSIAASIVYDSSKKSFVTDPEKIRMVLATKDLKKLTVADPIFFALGETTEVILASKYETQNVRNFASFSSLTREENNILEIFLTDYEEVMRRVANVSRITQGILFPEDSLKITYLVDPPELQIDLKNGFFGGRFSYEGFQLLIASYEELNHEYTKLSADLAAFSGELPEYQPGAIIREKWEVQVTKEGILEEVRLIEENGQLIKEEIGLRKDVFTHSYEPQINEAKNRIGINPGSDQNQGLFTPIKSLLSRLKNFFFGLLGIGALLLLAGKPPKKGSLHLLCITIILTGIFLIPSSYSTNHEGVPTMNQIISLKVDINEEIVYKNLASDLNDTVIEEILKGFRLFFKGETVEVRGPYDYYKKPYYFFDIKKDGVPTGNGFLVDAEQLRLVGNQRQALQLLKTVHFSDLLAKMPLYIGHDPDYMERQAQAVPESPLDLFLTNLSLNVREGIYLEKEIIENPDFEILLNLTDHYVEAFILLQNIDHLVSKTESARLTGEFSKKLYLLDAYSRATRGLSTQEFLLGRIAQYRGRTLNRVPLISGLSAMGLRPSKAQVAHDLTSDLVHDNPYIWRKGRVSNPNLFARLSFREGTYTMPESTANLTTNT